MQVVSCHLGLAGGKVKRCCRKSPVSFFFSVPARNVSFVGEKLGGEEID